jgi:hypothetical protein
VEAVERACAEHARVGDAQFRPSFRLFRAGQDNDNFEAVLAARPAMRNIRWTSVDVAWELDSAVDAPRMQDGSTPNRVPVMVFPKVGGYVKTDFYNVYSYLRMFVDVSHDWCVGGLSSTQATDAGKVYLRGVLLVLKALGKTWVPSLPNTKAQARALVRHCKQLLAEFRRRPDWLRKLRFERRFDDVRWADVLHQVLRNNALGMDSLLRAMAPRAGLADPVDGHRRSFVFSCDHGLLCDALAHAVDVVELHLVLGPNVDAVPPWSRRIFRDLLSAFMLVPVPRAVKLKPSICKLFRVPDPLGGHAVYEYPWLHHHHWWSKTTSASWECAVKDYNNPKRLLRSGEAAASHDAAVAQRERAWSSRRSLAATRVWEGRRAQFNEAELARLERSELLQWIELNARVSEHNGQFRYLVLAAGARAHNRQTASSRGWTRGFPTRAAAWGAIADVCGHEFAKMVRLRKFTLRDEAAATRRTPWLLVPVAPITVEEDGRLIVVVDPARAAAGVSPCDSDDSDADGSCSDPSTPSSDSDAGTRRASAFLGFRGLGLGLGFRFRV